MVVVDASDELTSIAKYDTLEKTIARVSKVDGSIKVATGTYTAVRSVTQQ